MFKRLLKVPYWYLIAIPLLLTFMGAASNQAVLIANGDTFPVMVNAEKIQKWCAPVEDADPLAAIIHAITHQPAPDLNSCAYGGVFIDGVHTIMQPKDRLKFLADIFDFHSAIYSVGDGLLMAGEWIFSWAPLAWLVLVLRKFIEV